jgi:pimeloyl-ACP methyl ester carboxylesterase
MTEAPALFLRDKGHGRPLLLLHGIFSSHRIWQDQFAGRDRRQRLIAPDLPGFGQSGAIPVPGDIAGVARMVAGIIAARVGGPCDVLGYSMGGLVAQQLALDRPDLVARLVLYSTKPSAADGDRFEPFEATIARLQAHPLAETVRRNAEAWLSTPCPRLLSRCIAAAAGCSTESAIAALRAVQGWDIRGRLAAIACPTLVVAGDRDGSVSLATSVAHFRALPRSCLAVLPGCGHIGHLERPGLFSAVVRDFLDRA